jgi:hypothetical protein
MYICDSLVADASGMIKVSPFTDRVEKSILYIIDQSIKVSLIALGVSLRHLDLPPCHMEDRAVFRRTMRLQRDSLREKGCGRI